MIRGKRIVLTKQEVEELRARKRELLEQVAEVDVELSPYEPIKVRGFFDGCTIETFIDHETRMDFTLKIPEKELKVAGNLYNLFEFKEVILTIEPVLKEE